MAAETTYAASASFRIVAYMDKYDQPAGFVEGAPGVFYGTAGGYTHVGFSITPQGSMTVLASFPSGHNIVPTFVAGANGRLYSTVQISDNPASVFSITSNPGSEIYAAQTLGPSMTQGLPGGELLAVATKLTGTVISAYLATVDLKGVVTGIAAFPPSQVALTAIYASDGNFYGVAQATNAPTGYVFRVTPSGSLTQLYNFPSGSFYGYASLPLLQADDGNLYGALPNGGANGTGIIYKLTLSGQYTLLYTFPKNNDSFPNALIEGSDGNFYGATGGDFPVGGVGQLFRVTKSGQYTALYTLEHPARDGACNCTIDLGSDGMIYGTAQGAGATGAGAVFALDAGLPKPRPWAKQFHPESGPAGTRVLIWGSNLLGPSVDFNGVPAAAVFASGPNYVWATVPAGATSGPITVTTPGGANATHGSFTVE
ncbi:MAG TPA: choice-of-anchor tandem repeat GloVer-containing protein [Bryobacteraceae bacterium]|nr:choice-of-anchor tandem repeat GloVer-containing protein [Bryobacteraceae bacterium]